MNKTVLCIVDGLGKNEDSFGNAVLKADMKNLQAVMRDFPSTWIKASGSEVGLADEKDPGNSEVGHNAIGSGQRIKQGLALLNDKFESGEIFESDTWKRLAVNAKKTRLHVINLLSDGRLHSDIYSHLFKVIERCAEEGITLCIHALADGRDVPTQSVLNYISKTREHIKKCGADACIATIAGRAVLWMDRYEASTNLISDGVEVCALGSGNVVEDIEAAVRAEYSKRPDMTDETLPAFILDDKALIRNGDSVLLLNYRGDRAVEICKAFESGKYLSERQYAAIDKCLFAGVLQYDSEIELPKLFLCPPPVIANTLSEWLCKHNVRQYSVTETVKYGHLTYFFNGNRQQPFDAGLEVWKEFQSDVCANMYNSAPKMQAEKIVTDVIGAVEGGKYDFIKLNLPNPDMVGHTGDFDATVIACKTVDDGIGRLVQVCKQERANLVITADHGNAEFMKYEGGAPRSSHTNSLVPFVVLPFGLCSKVCGGGHACHKIKIKSGEFGLTNIAATICKLLDVPVGDKFNESIIE